MNLLIKICLNYKSIAIESLAFKNFEIRQNKLQSNYIHLNKHERRLKVRIELREVKSNNSMVKID